MPCGNSNMGLTIPKTPGSRRPLHTTIGIGTPRSNGLPLCTMLRSWRHRTNQEIVHARNPQLHTTKRTVARETGGAGARAAISIDDTLSNDSEGSGISNGIAMDLTTIESGAVAATGDGCQGSLLPIVTSRENGTRNFADASNHKRCRAAARFLRRARVNSQMTATNNVDCHRWCPSGNSTAGIIWLSPSLRT